MAAATFSRSPVAPFERKDIRADNLSFKYDKDKREKWSNGVRPPTGMRSEAASAALDETAAGHDRQRMKLRPHKQPSQRCVSRPHPSRSPSRAISDSRPSSNRWPEYKSHANKAPKPYAHGDGRSRLAHKNAAIVEAKDIGTHSSKSLLAVLPTHVNNAESAIQLAIRRSVASDQADILYSFDNRGPSPGDQGRNVDLGGLIDLAEQKFLSEQTDKIVKGEYEVLDHEGETTVIGRGKARRSPKQKAVKTARPVVVDDDGFEFIERDL